MKFLKGLVTILFFSPFISFAQNVERINSGELLEKGSRLYDSGEYKKALLVYDEISRNDTNYVKSLLSKALTCMADSQFDQSLRYCKEGLSLKDHREIEPEIYNTYGNTLNNMHRHEDALKIFDSAITKYPAFSVLYFNKAVVYLDWDSNAQAEQWFQKALLISPYMYSAHYQLSIAALRQGKIIPAFLSFIGYLLVYPDGKYEQKSITLLSAISKSTDDILAFKNKRNITLDDNYQLVEDILLSKIALDKAYKPMIALDDPISRQIQAVFEKLEYREPSNDFWIQYYLPFFKQVYNSGKFELFINYIFSGVKIPEIENFTRKNKKAVQALIDDAVVYFNQLRSSRELFYKKRASVKDLYAFENGNFAGIGSFSGNGKQLVGPWHFYYPAGNIKAIGKYDDTGNREGEWIFYYQSGKLKSKEHYRNGKLEGPLESYFENGVLASRNLYVNDKLDGLAVSYYYVGSMKSSVQYKTGKIDGDEKEFYSNGNLQAFNNYSNDIHTGASKSFYKSGQLKETQQYENGKLNGTYKSYYEDGTLNSEGEFKNDKAEGEWKYYHENGKLREKSNFANNVQEGANEEYYDNGKISSSYIVKKGKANSEALYNDKDGKLYAKYIFDNGTIKSAKYFDKAGHEISSSESRGNMIDVVSFTPDGFKKMHCRYNKTGDIDGSDTLFYPSGKISQINEYKNGEENGLAASYYLNGNKKSQINMTGGKEDGHYIGYYFNGQIESEGWFANGVAQGDWLYYDELGKLTSKSYFLDGELSGYRNEYLPNGKISVEEKYLRGWLGQLTQFDSAGNILVQDSFPQGTGKYELLYANKKKMVEANYVYGDFDGAYKTYYFDGSIESIQFFKKGLKDSGYIAFHYGGIKSAEGDFKNGKKTGTWKYYAEDGKISSTAEYANDQLNGSRKYFLPDGNVDFESIYKDDVRNGYGKKYDVQGTLCYQVLAEDDDMVSYSYLGTDGKLVPFITVPADKGSLKSYFPNGKISRQCSYSDGKVNGADIVYYMNGEVHSIDTSSYGITLGGWKEFYEDGKLKLDYHYLYDNLHGHCKEFYKNGSLKKEMEYLNGLNHGFTKYYDDKGMLVKSMLYYYGKLILVKNEK